MPLPRQLIHCSIKSPKYHLGLLLLQEVRNNGYQWFLGSKVYWSYPWCGEVNSLNSKKNKQTEKKNRRTYGTANHADMGIEIWSMALGYQQTKQKLETRWRHSSLMTTYGSRFLPILSLLDHWLYYRNFYLSGFSFQMWKEDSNSN